DRSEDQLERSPKRHKSISGDPRQLDLHPSSSNTQEKLEVSTSLEFSPEGESLMHYAWIATLQFPLNIKSLTERLDSLFERALGSSKPNQRSVQIIEELLLQNENIVKKISDIHAIDRDEITHRITLLFKGICSLNVAFESVLGDIAESVAHLELGLIFQRFSSFLHGLNEVATPEIANPGRLPYCTQLAIKYLTCKEKDYEADVDHRVYSSQKGWKFRPYSQVPYRLISTPQAMKTRFIVHFLGAHYKLANPAKWQFLFKDDLSFVKLFALLRQMEFQSRLLRRLGTNRATLAGNRNLFPWREGFKESILTISRSKGIFGRLSNWRMDTKIKQSRSFSLNFDLNKQLQLDYIGATNVLDDCGVCISHYAWIGSTTYPRNENQGNKFWNSRLAEFKTKKGYSELIQKIKSKDTSDEETHSQIQISPLSVLENLDLLTKEIIKLNSDFLFIFKCESDSLLTQEMETTMQWFFKQVSIALESESHPTSNQEEEIISDLEQRNDLHEMILKYFRTKNQHGTEEKFNLENMQNLNKVEFEILTHIKPFEGFCTKLGIKIIGSYYKENNPDKWKLLFKNDLDFVKLFATFKTARLAANYTRNMKTNWKYWKADDIFPWKESASLYNLEAKRAKRFGWIPISQKKSLDEIVYSYN
ncbi:hypothetical protein MJO28_003846, partial [Puccinia striiformis f. sp. tritici]